MKIWIPLFTVLIALLTGCRPSNKDRTQYQIFKYNEYAGITSLDPAFARSMNNMWAVNQIFNGLVQFDEKLKVNPCIAKSWTITNDGRTYLFHLRTDVWFHPDAAFVKGQNHKVTASGSDFTKGQRRKVIASDFVYSFNRLIDPKVASPGAWVFEPVDISSPVSAFEAPDDSTLVIHLKKAFPPFLGLLCMQYCSVVPKEVVARYGDDFRNHPIGTGPFQLKRWKEGVKMVLTRNPHYFETENGKQLPYLDAVSISFIVDKQAAFLEFIKGNLDFMSGIDASYKDEVLTRSGRLKEKYKNKINLLRQPYLNTEYLGFYIGNPGEQSNPLNDIRIRQAINYGFDRVKMVKHLRNSIGIPGIYGFIPTGMPGFDSTKVTGYSYQPEKSRQLLLKAGYPNGKGLPPIKLITNASYLDLCKYIQQQLNQIGFDIRIDVTPPATLREMMAQGKAPFFRGSWIADYPDAENYLSLFYSKNYSPIGPNYTHFSNKTFDQLFEQSRNVVNDSARFLLYSKMDNLIMNEAPAVVLYYDEVLRFTNKRVTGLGNNPMNLLTLKHVKIRL